MATKRESVRPARRAGPNGQIVIDIDAETAQARRVRKSSAGPGFTFFGGVTLIIAPTGEVRYAILKSVIGTDRVERRRQFFATSTAQKVWNREGNLWQPPRNIFALMHKCWHETAPLEPPPRARGRTRA